MNFFSPELADFLATVLRGAQLALLALTLGGVVHVVFLARPLSLRLGEAGPHLLSRALRVTTISASILAAVTILSSLLGLVGLMGGLDLDLRDALGADFLRWNGLMIASAMTVALAAGGGGQPPRQIPLVIAGLLILVASVMTSHAVARPEQREYFLLADAFHQAGAATWIGGIPYLLAALRRVAGRDSRYRIGIRFSNIAMLSVLSLVVGAAGLAWLYIGSVEALIGTAYGAMTLTKLALFVVLMIFAYANMRAVRALARNASRDPGLQRLRRFAEVEIGIGVCVLFIAASLGSQPPAIEQPSANLVTPAEIVARLTPEWPRLSSPSVINISIPDSPSESVPMNDADRAWSEANHHWAALFVLAMGALALLQWAGLDAARHWPLLFIGLAAMLFFRSDPESWPLGPIGFFERMQDPEVLEHRILILMVGGFGLFEWLARIGKLKGNMTALLFPLLCAIGGTLLLAHSHSVSDAKQSYLLELTHMPMSFLGIIAGWTRWLELRSDGPVARASAWIWPICFILIGALLLDYRES